MTIKSTEHKDQEAFQNNEELKKKAKSLNRNLEKFFKVRKKTCTFMKRAPSDIVLDEVRFGVLLH